MQAQTAQNNVTPFPTTELNLDRHVVLDLIRVTEKAAIAAVKHLGRGDKNTADGAAVEAMRNMLNKLNIHATVVIGEGEKDDAPMLYEGEVVGSDVGRIHGAKFDIAVDPIDGTTIVSEGGENAISVIAIAEEGAFLQAPEAWYMQKLAMGPAFNPAEFSLDMPVEQVIKTAARQKGVETSEIVVCVLKRERHNKLMEEIRAAGARIKLITDGDVAGAIATSLPDGEVDLLMGIGGSPEGVIAAAALKCLGGNILGRLYFNDAESLQKARLMGVENPEKVYTTSEMAKGDVVFAATGITNGTMLKGVRSAAGGRITHSVVMRSKTGTIRWVEAFHKDK